MLRTFGAFVWLRWRVFINALERTTARDTLERFSVATEKLGPIITLLMIGWMRYAILKPRVTAGWVDLRRPAEIDEHGEPVFPIGEPYSLAERMIYEPGATRSVGGDELLVSCPKCGLVRSAAIDTCGNCGLTFSLTPPTRVLRPASPPPGGRAAV
jgi:hypothetical protein